MKSTSKVAEGAVEFINSTLTNIDGKLTHRFRDGEAKLTATLDDYAFIIWGLLELYQSNFELKYLKRAIELNDIATKYYWDESNGGFFYTADFTEDLLLRTKEVYDSAIPSGSSVMMHNLIRLSRLTSNDKYEKSAELLSKSFSENVKTSPMAFTYFLCGFDFAKGPSTEIILAGKTKEDLKPFLTKLNEHYLPNSVTHVVTEDNLGELKKLAPFIVSYSIDFTKPIAYVCKNFACELPVTSPEEMIEKLI